MNTGPNFKRMILAWLFCLATEPHFSQSDTGTLTVSIHDQASGEVVPAMICITSLADNSWRVPPDGRVPAGYLTNPDIIQGRLKGIEYLAGPEAKWAPGDRGPAVLMNGTFEEDRRMPWPRHKRNPWYDGKPAVPFWKDPVAYFVSKPFSITLPPGNWRLSVMRGNECLPVFDEFTMAAGQNLERKVQLVRWADLAKEGWYSADMHVHSPRIAPVQDEYLMTWAQAMDIHLTGVHSYGNAKEMEGSPQAHYGRDSRYQQGDYWLESGHEDPRTPIQEQGHVTQLGVKEIMRDVSKYHLYDYVFDGVHAQGGLVGYTHLPWSGTFFHRVSPDANPGWDASINTIRGKLDFFDILEAATLGYEDYYDFLNLGVKLTAMADSDCPAAVVGEERTYAYTGPGKFNPETWLAAMKHGRTFVSNGPILLLTVDGAMPGDEVPVHGVKDAKVHIHAQVRAPELIGAPKLLEVVSHGRVIRSAEARNAQQGELTLDFDLPAGESTWIAARTTCFNTAVAHTSPVYVIVDGASFVDRATLPDLVAKRLKILDFIERERLNNPKMTANWAPGEVEQLRLCVADARAKYLALGKTR
jgi:hypothetical protein